MEKWAGPAMLSIRHDISVCACAVLPSAMTGVMVPTSKQTF
jgi:hypothetical protein